MTVHRLTHLERQTDEWKQRTTRFTEVLEAKFQAPSSDLSNITKDAPPEKVLDLDNKDPEFLEDFNQVIDDNTIKNADEARDMEIGEEDPYLNMELGLPRGDDEELKHAHVKRRTVDVEGRHIGRPSTNPLLDSRQYEVKFMDGDMEILTVNIIAENLLAQVDEEGHRQMLIDKIEDHRTKEDAIPINEGNYTPCHLV
jgi:hypothetical protein